MYRVSFGERVEELVIWQDARGQVKLCYRCFGAATPGVKDYSFRDQLQRAALSVMNNILACEVA
mgnify:CR=1 FL=1